MLFREGRCEHTCWVSGRALQGRDVEGTVEELASARKAVGATGALKRLRVCPDPGTRGPHGKSLGPTCLPSRGWTGEAKSKRMRAG